MTVAAKEEKLAATPKKCNSKNETTASSTPSSPALPALLDFWTAFARMQEQDVNVFVWPTPKSPSNHISSTFGVRLRKSGNNCNDFHRGVDMHGNVGDPVVASYGGTVQRVMCFSGGNQVVILEHTFDFPVRFHDSKITKWYTLYLHLHQQLVTEGDVVQAGDLIGTLGDTGVLPGGAPHLHHEVRLGTRCSLEYRLQQHPPSSSSSSSNGKTVVVNNKNKKMVDPHVHPLYIYPRHLLGIPSITMTLKKQNAEIDGRVVLIETTDTCPNINRYEVQMYYSNKTTVPSNNNNELSRVARNAHVLDYNHRIGFNPTTTQELDTVDSSKPYLQPIPFGYKAARWRIKLVIPTSWALLQTKDACIVDDEQERRVDLVVVVTVTNIWQDAPTRLTFGWNSTSCT